MRARPLLHATRQKAAAEEGVALMEVIISAAVLIIVVLGVLAAMDAISGTAGANQARTVSAALAEDDQESLRGLSVEDLDRLEEVRGDTRTVKVGSVTYTIKSEAVWVTDSTGQEASCALAVTEGSYMRIKSTVTSPATGAKVPPVVISSIVAPQPGEGTLAAKVLNAAGQPVQNMSVTATGPDSRSAVTNAAGCAVFGQLEAGSYQVTVNEGGWVDKDGVAPVTKSATVSSGNLTTVEFLMDRAASFSIIFRTKYNRGAGEITADDRSTGALLVHTGMQSVFKTVPAGTEPAFPGVSTVSLTSLFPFTNPYKIYSGRCTGNDPLKYVANYFDVSPGIGQVVQLTPGQIGGQVTVLEPAMDVLVRYRASATSGTYSAVSGANVYAYPKTVGCTFPAPRLSLGSTNSSGRVTYPGLPFGDYDLCFDYDHGSGSENPRRRIVVNNFRNQTVGGTQVAADFNQGVTAATCGSTTPTS